MKRYLWGVLAGIVTLCSITALSCHASHWDSKRIYLEYTDAPEGTAYADVLAQIGADDASYTAFNTVPRRLVSRETVNGEMQAIYEPLAVTETSEIAVYSDEGYVSLSLHSAEVTDFILNDPFNYEYRGDYLLTACDADDLYHKYKHFKIAYIGENGEVLGVTDPTKGEIYSREGPYEGGKPFQFAANGSKAEYITPYCTPIWNVLILAGILIVFTLPTVLLYLILWCFVHWLLKKKRVSGSAR